MKTRVSSFLLHMLGLLLACSFVLCSEAAFAQTSSSPFQQSLVRPAAVNDKCNKPRWPKNELDSDHEGAVQIAVLVGVDGRAVSTTVQYSTGFPKLAEAAQAALMKCTFSPGTVNGQPVPMLMTRTYNWFTYSPGQPGEYWMKVFRSAQEGNVPALYSIAQLRLKDPDTISDGIVLLKIVANAGYALAQYELATRYELGDGLERNIELAEVWYAKAADQDELLAAERRRLIQEHGIR